MKVVHVNFWDKRGGAAIAANRLHVAMLQQGIESKMLVFDKLFDDRTVISLDSFFNRLKISIYNIIESRLLAKFRPFVGNFSISSLGLNLNKHQLIKEADIVYLHWINNDFVSISTIDKILKLNKPVYWFLHDMWAITGGCHHSFGCSKYQMQCGSCVLLKSKKEKDISYRILKRKGAKISSHTNLNIIAPSNWLGDCASKSALFAKHEINVIPNLVDVTKFKKLDQSYCRKILGLPAQGKIILFGADLGAANPYKGWEYLKQALIRLDGSRYLLATFGGEANSSLGEGISFNVFNLGRLFDDYSMCMLYNACDVFVIPSLAEAFGQTALESIACGTPVVGFNVGGIPDIIEHKRTGYLANYKDVADLSAGISWVLEECDYEEISDKGIANANIKFSTEVVVDQHIRLIS